MSSFKHLNTWNDVHTQVKKQALSYGLSALKSKIAEKYIYMDDAVERIWTALVMGKNALLYGPGGYAKTNLVKDVLSYLNIPMQTIVVHPGITVEHLFGVPNMKKLMEESKLEYAWHQTYFAYPGVLALEEGLDAQGDIMATLKDIITERGLRDRDKFFESLASSFIITTNKSPEEYAKDDSIKAFVDERFPYTYRVIWDSHEYDDYYNLFKTVISKEKFNKHESDLGMLAELCEYHASNAENVISPRKAIYAAENLIELGISSIKNLNFSVANIGEVKRRSEKKKSISKLKIIIANTDSFLNTEFYGVNPIKPIDIAKKIKLLDSIQISFGNNSFPDEMSSEVKAIRDKIIKYRTTYTNNLFSSIKLDKVDLDKIDNYQKSLN